MLADTAATEIRDAFDAYGGRRWETRDGREKAVPFEVEVPSLRGKSVQDLNPQGYRATGDFKSRLYSAGGTHVNGRMTGRSLHSIHADPVVVDGTYTGAVKVNERSNDFD